MWFRSQYVLFIFNLPSKNNVATIINTTQLLLCLCFWNVITLLFHPAAVNQAENKSKMSHADTLQVREDVRFLFS